MYNEKDDQIFIQLQSDQEPTEFLLDKQCLEMIRSGIVSKVEIRDTVETGRQDVIDTYSKAFIMSGYDIIMNVYVRIDEFLRVVEYVEKTYF